MAAQAAPEVVDAAELASGDFYAILGCAPASSATQITAEYRARARSSHPDKTPPAAGAISDSPTTESSSDDAMSLLNEAYFWLGDASRRAQYDAWRGSGIHIRFRDWVEIMKRGGGQTFHWAAPDPGPAQLGDGSEVDGGSAADGLRQSPNHHSSAFLSAAPKGSAIKAFREYRV